MTFIHHKVLANMPKLSFIKKLNQTNLKLIRLGPFVDHYSKYGMKCGSLVNLKLTVLFSCFYKPFFGYVGGGGAKFYNMT